MLRRNNTKWIGEKPAHPSSLLFPCLSSQVVAFEDGGEAEWVQQAGHKEVRYIIVGSSFVGVPGAGLGTFFGRAFAASTLGIK